MYFYSSCTLNLLWFNSLYYNFLDNQIINSNRLVQTLLVVQLLKGDKLSNLTVFHLRTGFQLMNFCYASFCLPIRPLMHSADVSAFSSRNKNILKNVFSTRGFVEYDKNIVVCFLQFTFPVAVCLQNANA